MITLKIGYGVMQSLSSERPESVSAPLASRVPGHAPVVGVSPPCTKNLGRVGSDPWRPGWIVEGATVLGRVQPGRIHGLVPT